MPPFPEATRGKYLRLGWAKDWLATGLDWASIPLRDYLEWYKENELVKRESTIQALEAQKNALTNELNVIRNSFGYKIMRLYASRIDRLFPDGTSRGEFRQRIVAGLRARTERDGNKPHPES